MSPGPPSSSKEQQKHRSHDAILGSAARLLRERGPTATSVAEVMAGAGLTVGGFYAHFADKNALLEATLRRTAEEMGERLLAFARGESRTERLTSILRAYLSRAHRDDVVNGCPLPATVAEVSTSYSPLAPALGEVIEVFVRRIGSATPGGAPRKTALAMLALMYGGLSLARATRGSPLSDQILQACREFGADALSRQTGAPP